MSKSDSEGLMCVLKSHMSQDGEQVVSNHEMVFYALISSINTSHGYCHDCAIPTFSIALKKVTSLKYHQVTSHLIVNIDYTMCW